MKFDRKNIAVLSISAAAIVGIATHEGFRDKAYDDGVGVQTVGFGTTGGVKKGDKITVERALIRLLSDADAYKAGMAKCVKVPLSQGELDAYLSLTYNVGVGAFCGSTLVKKLNARDYSGACHEILRWNRAGGKVLAGLTKRRESEFKKCMESENGEQ